jgi:hypothetical protein
MKLSILLTRTVMVGCLAAGALGSLACADGPGGPTSPSRNAAISTSSGLLASGNQAIAGPSSASSLAASSPMHRLLLTKTCDAKFPDVPVCTVVILPGASKPEGPLAEGTTAVYDFHVIDFTKIISSDVVLTTAGGTAAGHCTLSFKTGVGTCTFARGTGELAGFHANVQVAFDFATGVTTWDGTYHFSGYD